MKGAFSRVFTLEVDGRAILSFEASRTREAQQICKESWLRNDLIKLSVRAAIAATKRGRLEAISDGQAATRGNGRRLEGIGAFTWPDRRQRGLRRDRST
jgi:hypothetical protein